jgi:hypothetical protein
VVLRVASTSVQNSAVAVAQKFVMPVFHCECIAVRDRLESV